MRLYVDCCNYYIIQGINYRQHNPSRIHLPCIHEVHQTGFQQTFFGCIKGPNFGWTATFHIALFFSLSLNNSKMQAEKEQTPQEKTPTVNATSNEGKQALDFKVSQHVCNLDLGHHDLQSLKARYRASILAGLQDTPWWFSTPSSLPSPTSYSIPWDSFTDWLTLA